MVPTLWLSEGWRHGATECYRSSISALMSYPGSHGMERLCLFPLSRCRGLGKCQARFTQTARVIP